MRRSSASLLAIRTRATPVPTVPRPSRPIPRGRVKALTWWRLHGLRGHYFDGGARHRRGGLGHDARLPRPDLPALAAIHVPEAEDCFGAPACRAPELLTHL